ncbi:snRNA-activating protein complex subunit 1 [Orchesella cincta]|uniref:snRNA-activating protein complex subunit 1 n=1 Tax=Orchesella cincta TaxID=48709 RepID=A0A1D2NHF7_ORCCI|nr:snRNA-activating protein complex subunit 1 [Orchesella cincta]
MSNNPKTLVRLWAALSSDFEGLMSDFMRCSRWRYIDFARLCREAKITLVMHVTQGRGKTKDEYYDRVTDMILQICKDLWLKAGTEELETRRKTPQDKSMELKRALGGFYLMYTLYEKQPIRGRVKISLGMVDLKSMHKFIEAINAYKETSVILNQEVTFMLQYLMFQNAFHYCIFAEEFRFDAPTRYFLNSSKSEVVELTRRMRDNQDVLAYSSNHQLVEESFVTMGKFKNAVAKDVLRSAQAPLILEYPDQSVYSMLVRTLPLDAIRQALSKLDKLVDTPIATLQNLTATEAIDRKMMMETRRRMERARKKATQAQDRDGEHKAVRPYVREGGIFGRKKEVEEGEDRMKKRERGACTGNLWTYINGHDFDKPMGEPREKPPPAPATSTGTNNRSSNMTNIEDMEVDPNNE